MISSKGITVRDKGYSSNYPLNLLSDKLVGECTKRREYFVRNFLWEISGESSPLEKLCYIVVSSLILQYKSIF